MSGGSKREREERALDALLISALRRDDKEGDNIDPKRLPKLTDEEKAAMNALGTDFVQRLLAGQRPVQKEAAGHDQNEEEAHDPNELAMAGSDAGLNRAEEIDDETAEELERRKREILERKKREREEGGGGGA